MKLLIKYIFCCAVVIVTKIYLVFCTYCNIISSPTYQVPLKDFNLSDRGGNYYYCTAAYCSVNHSLKAFIHSFNYSAKHDTLVYAGLLSAEFNEDCGNCPVKNTNTSNSNCKPCQDIKESSNIDIYFRVGSPKSNVSSVNPCLIESFFNITVHERQDEKVKKKSPKNCHKDLLVSFPQGNSCDIIDLKNSSEICIKPSCSDGVINKIITEGNVEGRLNASTSPQTCIWKINTKDEKYIELEYSENLKNHLILFEGTLLSPKWNLKKCSLYNTSITLKLPVNTFYIMYKNDFPLESNGSFIVKFLKDLCPLPPMIKNGKEEFFRTKNGTFSLYSCDKGFDLVGPDKIFCEDDIWESAPVCVANKATFDEYSEGSGTSRDYPSVAYSDSDISPEVEDGSSKIFSDEFNSSVLSNGTNFPTWRTATEEEEDNLFPNIAFSDMEENTVLFIIFGAGILVIIIITIISIILCRNRGSNLNHTFDTFQNPIYEKPVVHVPIPRSDTDPGQEKLDLGDLSDSTVLE